ncbi:MAG TPA: hypothetical protein VM733_12205 [Thermoanaerobaculia bacterium]|nr:hypothetical protein [Thermoanaerobaculia bacterium]
MIGSLVLAAALAADVRIQAGWVGLGVPVSESYVVKDRAAADRIARAVAAPRVSFETAMASLTSPQWFREHAAAASGVRCSAEARTLFVNTLTKPGAALAAARDHYRGMHTDDFPGVTVTIGTIKASTTSQHALMLPWTTPSGETWNPELSRAVAAAMPASSKLRARLLDDSFGSVVANVVGDDVRDRVLELDARCLYAPMIAKIAKVMTIDRVYQAWPDRLSVHAHVAGTPSNLRIDAHLRPAELDAFLGRAPKMVEIARTFAASHASTPLEIWYVDGASAPNGAVRVKVVGDPMKSWVLQP